MGFGTNDFCERWTQDILIYYAFAVNVIVTTTLFCEMAIFAKFGGWMPKSVMPLAPAGYLSAAAKAIIAPLSVQSRSGGK